MRFLLRVRMLLLIAPAVAGLAAVPSAQAGFVNREIRDADGVHRYAVFVPQEYTPRRKWPVVLFLHGAGERGTDGLRPTTVGLGPLIRRNPRAFPFIVVFPQCENLRGRLLECWHAGTHDGRRALRILKDVEAAYNIDPRRRILTGWSMGGYGAWSFAAERPDFWSAVVPVSGGGDPATAGKLRGVPIWAFHGERDEVVLARETRGMAEAVRRAGGNAHFTLVKGIGHDVWKAVYSHPQLLDWMQNPSSRVRQPAEITATSAQKAVARDDKLVPFVPAVEISRGVTVCVPNNVLKALSYSVPQMVDRKLLSRKVGDIKDTIFTDGHTFNLEFIGVKSSGTLVNADVRAARGNRLKIRLGLRDVRLHIKKTHVIGRRRWAATGPMQIIIGQRRPVWLTMELRPLVEKRQLRFRVLSKSFNIADDNWQVSAPSAVEVHGLGMTKQKIRDGLVSGVKERKDRIEKEVLAVVPRIVSEIEKKLAVPDSMKPIAGLWPLPVYQPRLHVRPDSAQADENGMTVTFAVTAAAIDPSQAPQTPRRIAGSDSGFAETKEAGLRVGIAKEILPALTQVLIDADVARLHVSDIPSSPFAEFVDRSVMTDILPDLKRFGPKLQVSSELMIRKPLRVVSRSTDGSGPAFEIPEAALVVSLRTSPDADWKPCAEFTIRLSHPLKFDVRKEGFSGRAAVMQWRSKPTIAVQGRFLSGFDARTSKIDDERVRAIFAKGWKEWSASFSRSNPRVPDVVFGNLPLRLRGLDWTGQRLVAAFAVPGIRITNETRTPLTYEAKGPRSSWGGPYTLPPAESHEFAVPYAIVFRQRIAGRTRKYTLPPGSHSAYRAPSGGEPPAMYLAK